MSAACTSSHRSAGDDTYNGQPQIDLAVLCALRSKSVEEMTKHRVQEGNVDGNGRSHGAMMMGGEKMWLDQKQASIYPPGIASSQAGSSKRETLLEL